MKRQNLFDRGDVEIKTVSGDVKGLEEVTVKLIKNAAIAIKKSLDKNREFCFNMHMRNEPIVIDGDENQFAVDIGVPSYQFVDLITARLDSRQYFLTDVSNKYAKHRKVIERALTGLGYRRD
jgi:CRISPR/Cas system CSM-associated protein Csm4 (group 5 of RAMP superfamily)